jgi:undecaprenyl-diphosphatase
MNDSSLKKRSLAGVFIRTVKYLGWEMIAGLFAATGAVVLFLWLADEVFEGSTKVFDAAVRETVHRMASPWLTSFMLAISFIGSFYVLFPASCLTAVLLGVLKWKRALVLFLFTMIGEQILENVLKEYYRRARPDAFFDYPLPASYSFPSGHALAALCFFGVLAWLITARLKNVPLRIAIWAVAAFMIVSIGLSRIYLGVHYPSDVLAGYVAAVIWIAAIAVGDLWFALRRRHAEAAANASPAE